MPASSQQLRFLTKLTHLDLNYHCMLWGYAFSFVSYALVVLKLDPELPEPPKERVEGVKNNLSKNSQVSKDRDLATTLWLKRDKMVKLIFLSLPSSSF